MENSEQENKEREMRRTSSVLGQPSLMDVIGPAYWSTDDLMEDEFVMRENMKSKTYGIAAYIPPHGYPRMVNTAAFQEVLSLGYVDTTLDVVPRTRHESMRELSNMLNVIRSNAQYQEEKGMSYQLRDNIAKYSDIDNLLDELQFDQNRIYDVCISFIVYGSSDREVKQNFGRVADILANEGMSVYPYAKRQKSGYLQTIPIGARMANLDDTYRNVDRKSLAVMDIARNAAGIFNGGIPFGNNQATPSQNTEFLSVFGSNTHRPINYNMGIVGESGAGKSLSLKIKIARELTLLGIEHRSIDPDGEYVLLAKKLGQLNLTIVPDAQFVINPCAVVLVETPLDEETMTDRTGRLLDDKEIEENIALAKDGRRVVTHADGTKFIQKANVLQTITNIEDFVDVILAANGNESGLTAGEKRRLEEATESVIEDLGITVDPDSLYTNKSGMRNGTYYERLPKPEPTLSDIYQKLVEMNTDEDGNEDPKVSRLLDGLKPYLKTGTKPLFDGQTYFGQGRSSSLNDYRYVNFNISQLDGSLREVTYFVLAQYLWVRWMTNPTKRTAQKCLTMDEILQFIDNPKMAATIEKIVRRCRKYNGSICWATQDTERLDVSVRAKALVTNSETMFVLRISPEHRERMQKTMSLSDGAMDILTNNPEPGEGILKQENNLIWIRTNPSASEMSFAESNRANARSQQEKDFLSQMNRMANLR